MATFPNGSLLQMATSPHCTSTRAVLVSPRGNLATTYCAIVVFLRGKVDTYGSALSMATFTHIVV